MMSGTNVAASMGERPWITVDPASVDVVWREVARSVLKLIMHSGMHRCPVQHRDAVFDDVQSAFFVEAHRQAIHRPRGFALTIAAHRIADHIREDARRGSSAEDLVAPGHGDAVEDIELTLALRQAVADLRSADPVAAQVVELRLEGATRQEIGCALGLSAVRIHRLLRKARPYLVGVITAAVVTVALLCFWGVGVGHGASTTATDATPPPPGPTSVQTGAPTVSDPTHDPPSATAGPAGADLRPWMLGGWSPGTEFIGDGAHSVTRAVPKSLNRPQRGILSPQGMPPGFGMGTRDARLRQDASVPSRRTDTTPAAWTFARGEGEHPGASRPGHRAPAGAGSWRW
jgi:DNA-directed RNA polymerase specialized sigma24 family protein